MLPEGGTVTLRYTPARISRYALYLLPVMVLAAVVFMYAVRLPSGRPGIWSRQHRRRRRAELIWAGRPRLSHLLRRRRA